MIYRLINRYSVLLIVTFCVLSRLPQLLSSNLFLDGDECIVGLMAKHFSEGIGVPYFFYGQSYGFSFIEVLAIRIFYLFFGVNDLAVKLGMLSLWTVGVVFLYKTLKQFELEDKTWLPLLVTFAFIFAPSFSVWSMKARGGYLTAFLLTYIITFLIFSKKRNKYLITSFIIGLLANAVYQSQALWMAGLIPILIYYVMQTDMKYNISLFSGVMAGMLLFSKLKVGLSTFWAPQVLHQPDFSMDGLISVIVSIYRNQTGSYFYETFIAPSFVTKAVAIIVTLSIFCALVTGAVYLVKKKGIHPFVYVLSISVVLSISYLFFIDNSNARYILPINSYIFPMFFLLLASLSRRKIVYSAIGVLTLMGTYSLYDFRNFSPERKATVVNVIGQLTQKNTRYIYCEGGLLQWQLMFYSNEQVIARSKSNIDRYPEYVRAVDDAFYGTNEKTALVGYSYDSNSLEIFEDPDKNMLEQRGFNMDVADESK